MEQMQFLFVKGAALSYCRAATINLLVVIFRKGKWFLVLYVMLFAVQFCFSNAQVLS